MKDVEMGREEGTNKTIESLADNRPSKLKQDDCGKVMVTCDQRGTRPEGRIAVYSCCRQESSSRDSLSLVPV